MAVLPALMTALVTPFNKDGEIDEGSLEKLAAHMVDQGSDGLVVTGTTGESATMSHEEDERVWKIVKNAVGDRATIVAGVGLNCTSESIMRAKNAEKVGVDAVMAVTPYYVKPSQRGILHHFTQVAGAVDIPLVVYNIPGRTAMEIEPRTVAEIAQIENVIALKDVVGDPAKLSWIINNTKDDFLVYSGEDSAVLPWLAMGAHGVISVASHLVCKEMKEMIDVFETDPLRSREIHLRLSEIFSVLFSEPNPAPVKAGLAAQGLIENVLRPPMLEITEETEIKLLEAMKNLELL